MFPKFKINNELLGIFYMLLCQFSFATNDAFVKFVYQSYDEIFVLNQIIFIRGIFTLFFILVSYNFYKIKEFKINGLNKLESKKLYDDIKIFRNINIFSFNKNKFQK